MSVACRSRLWTCESATVALCKRAWLSWCGVESVLFMMWADISRSSSPVAAAARQSG